MPTPTTYAAIAVATRPRAEVSRVPAATPTSTMFPVITDVNALPRDKNPIASVVPLRMASPTTVRSRRRMPASCWVGGGVVARSARARGEVTAGMLPAPGAGLVGQRARETEPKSVHIIRGDRQARTPTFEVRRPAAIGTTV